MKNIYILALLLLVGVSLKSQINLNTQHLGTQTYDIAAPNYVSLLPGFEYLPQSTNFFRAYIDPLMVVPPTGGETGGPNAGDDGVVGSLSGDLSISPAGSANYSIPIDLPPGINGLVPQLALTYNSLGGNGLLGMRWSIAGLSSVRRTGTNIYNDGFIDGVDFDDNDKLMLDGNRLIPINSGIEFRTESESFSKIIPHNLINGQPEWFELYSKNGNILQYGYTENSRIQAPGLNDVLDWHINKVTDRKGNFMLKKLVWQGYLK